MLSIRTQDRMCLLPYDKRINIYKIVSLETEKYEIGLGGYPLGKYKTKERALEVLDEIEQHLEGHIYVKMARCEREGPDTEFDKKVDAPIVYEMPKE